jgi:hypothetical protein
MEKKRGRKKNTETLSPNTVPEKIPKKRGRKPKGGKIIVEETNKEPVPDIKPNIILHLKCKLNDIAKTNTGLNEYDPDNIETILHYNISQQNKGSALQYDLIDDKSKGTSPDGIMCPLKEEITKPDTTKDISVKLKDLSKQLHNNMQLNEHSACFWCTCEFATPPVFIPQYKKDACYHCYGYFCSPSCAAGYLFKENIDTSIKYERYQLLNFIYNGIYNYEKNIVPAPSPYYLLDKFCGNLTIEEYRKLMEQDKLILVMDKPLSRNYPELFEENNEYHVHTINTFSKKKKDMVKQNIFHVS